MIQLNHVIPEFNGKIVIDDKSKKGYPVNLENLYNDDSLKGTLRTNANVKAFMVNAYYNLKDDIQELINQIETELENRKT
jgi:hypothetical protein